MSRLPAGLLVSALLRRVNDSGGIGVVRARGHPAAGTILVIENGTGSSRALERGLDLSGKVVLLDSMAADSDPEVYWRRRREHDPDLWVLELSIPASERFAVLTMLED